MITIQLESNDFAYDMQSLTKAFYPQEEIKVVTMSDVVYQGSAIKVKLKEDSIGISFYENGIPILGKENKNLYGKDFVWKKMKEDPIEARRKQYKNELKILLYQVLSEVSGKTLSWGTMTGVRPTKIPMEHYVLGDSLEQIRTYMQEYYLCSKEKTELSLSIIQREDDILKEMDYKNGYSLYIGIPFCPTTCLYCSFTSYSLAKNQHLVEKYLEALYKEIDYAATCFPERKLLTVYIGGGTPTTLSAQQLEGLIIKIKEKFSFQEVKEFTVEAGRPDSITFEKLKVLKEQGVSRISINPQTMNQKTLDLIGRKHTTQEVIDAFHMARNAGHDNINMDLIVGLPGETCEDVEETLHCIRALEPDSFTVHSLVMKRAAQLNIHKEDYEHTKSSSMDEMLSQVGTYAEKEGYKPYYMYRQKNTTGSSHNTNQENIGYAKPRKEGVYNILIMEEKQTILALGAGAASKFVFPQGGRIQRVENVKSLLDYIERVDEMIERKRKFLLMEY